jgi:hypothetical protein
MASFNETYTASGSEGSTLTRTALIGYTVLLCYKGNYPLEQITSGTPTNQQFKFDTITGIFTFGSAIDADQVIQILYK